jgi:photosystem II stability/assembly factor-like uncharacterized protein
MDSQTRLFLATSNCIAICEPEGDDWRVVQRALMGNYTTSLTAHGQHVLVGTRDGIYRSDDWGDSWRAAHNGLTVRYIRWLAAPLDQPERIYAGSEPAGIFISVDGGSSWRGNPQVEDLRDSHGWYLPYSPEAGCVRGFAFSGERTYAAVEVGGALVSEDSGSTWGYADQTAASENKIHPDVHSIESHPATESLVAAPTGGGFYFSSDGGSTWENRYPQNYCRALWWDVEDADHMLLGSADWVDRNGRIEESWDGGRTWNSASISLDIPWHRHMVERFLQAGDDLLAVLSNGEVWITSLEEIKWKRILPEVQQVKAASMSWLDE